MDPQRAGALADAQRAGGRSGSPGGHPTILERIDLATGVRGNNGAKVLLVVLVRFDGNGDGVHRGLRDLALCDAAR